MLAWHTDLRPQILVHAKGRNVFVSHSSVLRRQWGNMFEQSLVLIIWGEEGGGGVTRQAIGEFLIDLTNKTLSPGVEVRSCLARASLAFVYPFNFIPHSVNILHISFRSLYHFHTNLISLSIPPPSSAITFLSTAPHRRLPHFHLSIQAAGGAEGGGGGGGTGSNRASKTSPAWPPSAATPPAAGASASASALAFCLATRRRTAWVQWAIKIR